MLCCIVLLCLITVWLVDSARFQSQDAARLMVEGIAETEHGSGAFFGTSRATADDLYINLQGGQLKTYRPSIFKALRYSAGVSEASWQACMQAQQLENISADSKSGQAFWRSKDGTLVLKTIKAYECRNIREIIEKLAVHMDIRVDHSCISAVLGVFRVKLKNGTKVYFMTCKNVYPTTGWYNTKKFDLKGSTVGRLKSSKSVVLKDLDLLRSNTRLHLGDMKSAVLHTLHRDVRFLSSCGFMDYSLLVDVEYVPAGFLRKLTSKIINPTTGAFRVRGKMVVVGSEGALYHFGIVDFLQKYTFRKWLETLLKSIIYDGSMISCVNPMLYASRMLKFIDSVTD